MLPPLPLLLPALVLVAVLAELQERMTDSRLSYRQRRKLEAAMASEDDEDETAGCDPTHCMVDFLAVWAGKLLLRVPLLALGSVACSRAGGDASECICAGSRNGRWRFMTASSSLTALGVAVLTQAPTPPP